MLIFLIGFMCSGKTTLARALARECHCLHFIDLDNYIEELHGKPVKEIFATEGEHHFRIAERNALERIITLSPPSITTLVACGGGTPCFFNNMQIMNDAGITVWLQPRLPVLINRLKLGKASRPLLADMDDTSLNEYANRLLAEREPFYSRAKHTFDSSNLETPPQIARSVKQFISLFINNQPLN